MTSSLEQTVFADIELALGFAQEFAPAILAGVAAVNPAAAAFAKFLPLIQVALQGVTIVQQATGSTAPTAPVASAANAVAATLTPGMPGAPALN